MTVTPTQVLAAEDMPFHEIVGLDVRVLGATNHSLVGLSGRIQYETKSMIMIMKDEGGRRASVADRAGSRQPHRLDASKGIPKKGTVLEFSQNGTRIGTASGNAMLKRPFERAAA